MGTRDVLALTNVTLPSARSLTLRRSVAVTTASPVTVTGSSWPWTVPVSGSVGVDADTVMARGTGPNARGASARVMLAVGTERYSARSEPPPTSATSPTAPTSRPSGGASGSSAGSEPAPDAEPVREQW